MRNEKIRARKMDSEICALDPKLQNEESEAKC